MCHSVGDIRFDEVEVYRTSFESQSRLAVKYKHTYLMKQLIFIFSLFFATTFTINAQRPGIDSLFVNYAGQTTQNTIDAKMLAHTGLEYEKVAGQLDSTELVELKQTMELLGRVKGIRTLSLVPGIGGAPDMYSGFNTLFSSLTQDCADVAKSENYKLVFKADRRPFVHIWYNGSTGNVPAAFLLRVEYSIYSQVILSVWGDLREQDALLLQQTLAPTE